MKRSMVNTGRIFLLLSLAITYVNAAAATPLKVATYGELRQSVIKHAPDLDQFRVRGPFDVVEKRNQEIRLPTGETIGADVYL